MSKGNNHNNNKNNNKKKHNHNNNNNFKHKYIKIHNGSVDCGQSANHETFIILELPFCEHICKPASVTKLSIYLANSCSSLNALKLQSRQEKVQNRWKTQILRLFV